MAKTSKKPTETDPNKLRLHAMKLCDRNLKALTADDAERVLRALLSQHAIVRELSDSPVAE